MRGGWVHSPADPHASAICVEDGQVVWLGDDDASSHFVDRIDPGHRPGGRLVTPAFVDAHAHLGQTGLDLCGVDLSTAESLADALRHDRCARPRTELPVVLGFGWDETGWPEGRLPTLAEVDRTAGGRPAYLSRVDGHSALVSSALLDRVPGGDPAGGWHDGRVERDAHHRVRRRRCSMLVPDAGLGAARRAAPRRVAGHRPGPRDGRAAHLAAVGLRHDQRGCRGEHVLPETIGYWGALGDVSGGAATAGARASPEISARTARSARAPRPCRRRTATPAPAVTSTWSPPRWPSTWSRPRGPGCRPASTSSVTRRWPRWWRPSGSPRSRSGTSALVGAGHRLEHVEMITAEQIAALAGWGCAPASSRSSTPCGADPAACTSSDSARSGPPR